MAMNFRIEVDIDSDFGETTVEIDSLYANVFGGADTMRTRGATLSVALRNLANLLESLRRDEIEIIGMKPRGLLRDLEPEEAEQ